MRPILFKKRDAFTVYLIMEGAVALFFALVFTVNMIYQVTVVDLNPLQLVLVGTLLEITVFLFEVPTGVVADARSRRLSVIVGMALIGIGFTIEGSIPRFGAVLLSQVFWGLGATFTSGATQAWIADEVGEERAAQAFMRGAQAGMIGGAVGIPISVGLGNLSLQLPIILGGLSFVGLAVFLALAMPEAGFRPLPPDERGSWHSMIGTFRAGAQMARGRPILLTYLGVELVSGLYSEGLDRLWTAHLLKNFAFPALDGLKPVTWFGLIGIASLALSAAATEIARRWLDTTNQRRVAQTLLAIHALTMAGILVFALTSRFGVALIALLGIGALRRVTGPILTAWINPRIDSPVRATVFSMAGQVNAIGQIAGGPGVGYIGKAGSLRAALVTSGLLLAPVSGLFARAMREEQDTLALVGVTAE